MRSILQYARRHHIAMLALFVALGGTSYAAIQIPRESVGTAQIRDESVRSKDVRDGALLPREFREGTLARSLLREGALDGSGGTGPAGPQGPAGPAGPSRLDEQLPAARARRTTAFQVPPLTNTIVPLEIEQYDIGGLFDPAAPTVMTIPVTGTYILTGTVRWQANAEGGRTLNLHGPQGGGPGGGGLRASSGIPANDGQTRDFQSGQLVADTTRQSVSTTERFQAGDQVFMSVSHDARDTAGATIPLNLAPSQNQIHLSAAFVGP